MDEAHPRPATLSVSEIDPDNGAVKREIPVLWAGAEPHFTIRILPLGETHVRARYTQRATDSSATYILTSTQPWGRELEYGEYFLIPDGVRITGSNYPLEQRSDRLAFVRRQFMPHENWRFKWTHSDPAGENE